MRPSLLTTIFPIASLFALVTAQINLDPFPDVVNPHKTYTISWNAIGNYTYTIWLVIEDNEDGPDPYGWTKVSGLVTSLELNSLQGSYSWLVPPNLSNESNYALWIDGFNIPFDGSGYSNITNWFTFSSSTNPASSGNIISPPTSSSSPPNSHHHKNPSSGEIAGIVIGLVVAIAFAIGAVFVLRRRRRQAGVKTREAEARADRLAPVMQENFPGYEMKTRTSNRT